MTGEWRPATYLLTAHYFPAAEQSLTASNINPVTTPQLINLAMQHHRSGQLQEAKNIYIQVLNQNPNQVDALNLLGALAGQVGQQEHGIALLRRAIELAPDYYAAYYNLGMALAAVGDVEGGIKANRRAAALRADWPQGFNGLSNLLRKMGRLDEALAAAKEAVRVDPDYADGCNNVGAALNEMGRVEEALVEYRRALALKPDMVVTRMNAAVALLQLGDLERGLPEYEWRWKLRPEIKMLPGPQWRGEELAGKTILLYGEQGMGDAIQFVRYAPMVANRGGKVLLQCHDELLRLMDGLSGVHQVYPATKPSPLYHVQCPLMSLPLAFGTRLETIPASPAYLKADPALAQAWDEKLRGNVGAETASAKLRVGIAWAGRADHNNDRNRSMQLSQLAPLFDGDNIELFSLQKGERGKDALPAAGRAKWFDYTADLHDFADTAGLVCHLDLVISVDSAVAHLAAAMGKPTWVMLPFVPDWRWMMKGETSPWYPSIRLFRQTAIGDWAGVVHRVREALDL
ncbi:MAG TPA: tetratricopeptide repeat protein [Humisphaera sp.]|nr:tetratricopeptide repeat protein [Humisphaera sp.]